MNNPFTKLLTLSKTVFSRDTDASVVGIDIGASSIKVVQIKKKKGKAILETYGTLSLGPYANTDVGRLTNLDTKTLSVALADLMKESGVSSTKVAVSIPSASSLIFILELPIGLDEKQLPSIVATEARKYIPVSISEVSLDWWPIPQREAELGDSQDGTTPPQKMEILVAAIHNETISKYKEIAVATSLTPQFFEIEVFGSVRSTFAHDLSATLLIDMGAMKTKLSIVEFGIVKRFHIVNRGSYDITNSISSSMSIPFSKAEDMKRDIGLLGIGEEKTVSDIARLSIDYIFSETNTVIVSYERKYNRPISKIILVGGGALIKGLADYSKTIFRSEIILGNSFSKVEAPAFLVPVLDEAGPEFSVSLGLALRALGE